MELAVLGCEHPHLADALARLGEPPRVDAVMLDRAAGAEDLGGSAVGRWSGVPLTLRVNRAVRDGGLRLSVAGSEATATLLDGVLELTDGAGAPERWVGGPPDPGEAVRAFAAALRRGRFPGDGLAPAVRAQEALERAPRR